MKNGRSFVTVLIASFVLVGLVHGGALEDVKAFKQGQKVKYDSKDSPKAKGLRLTVEYPSTWRAEDGQRPNIVQKFLGKDDFGNSVQAILLIKKLPFLARLTKNEILKENYLKEIVTEIGGTYVKSAPTKIERENAAWVIYTQDAERAGITMRAKALMFVVMFKGKWVQLQCAVVGLQSESTIDQRFNDYLPIFQLIGNSIVFPDKWK